MASKDTAILLDEPLNGQQYGSVLTSPSKTVDNGHEFGQHSTTICGIGISRLQFTILIAVITLMATVGFYIIMPIYLSDLVQAGSGPFALTVVYNYSSMVVFVMAVAVQWCYSREPPILHPNTRYMSAALIGLCLTLFDIMLTFGSIPTRTRPQLLGILTAALLPITIICRFVILRKGVSVKRLLCSAIVLFGVFVSLLPDIFSLGLDDGTSSAAVNSSHHVHIIPQTRNGPNHTSLQSDRTVVYGWIWQLVVVGSTVPLAIALVILEKETKSTEVSFLIFLFWIKIFKCLSVVALFWTTLIPHFGMTNGFDEFLTSLEHGLYCSFSRDTSCGGCLVSGIIFTFISPCLNAATALLTKYAEGAIYTTIIKACSKPLFTIFWTLFVYTKLHGLVWRPQYNVHTILTFVGLLLIIPATCLYTYFSNREDTSNNMKSKETKKT